MIGTKSKVIFRGLVCDLCQENINFDRCRSCGKKFMEDDIIFCINHSQTDCEHVCEKCWGEDAQANI